MKAIITIILLSSQVSCLSLETLQKCGEARYYPSRYTCYDTDFLCPIINGTPTLKCSTDCYSPDMYSCSNGRLVYPPVSMTSSGTISTISPSTSSAQACTDSPITLYLSDPPYENYFYSDCHSSSQVVVTSPLADSNLTIIGPRLLVAWPAGNSGVVAFFAPQNSINGSLGIRIDNTTSTGALSGVYHTGSDLGNPVVGVSGSLSFNTSANLVVSILGSIRTIRDFTEGPSILVPEIQEAIEYTLGPDGGISLSRLWLDNITLTTLSFIPQNSTTVIGNENGTVSLDAGIYNFTASFNYTQLVQLAPSAVLDTASQELLSQQPDQTNSLSFLSYTDKLLAGAWRFLTYFGRDSMISLLLLQPVLSEGKNGAIEAVIGAVLERINSSDGSVCHEETLGDYATYLNMENNISSTDPTYDYKMIDSDYYLPIAMQNYFLGSDIGSGRTKSFFQTTATVNPANAGLTYSDLALINAEKIMNTSAAFTQPEGQVIDNLIHIKEGQIVGEWRDSTYGIGGGRIPYDVNTALVPAALRSISALSAAGFYPTHQDWADLAASYAKIWEDSTLSFYAITVPATEAKALVENYVNTSGYGIPSQTSSITNAITYHALALDGNNNQTQVKVMNTDSCFRLFFLNTTHQAQLTAFLNTTATNILAPFPIGLSTPIGLLVANPAYGGEDVYTKNFTNAAYHGTVVWSWQLSMTAKGLERQLARCLSKLSSGTTPPSPPPPDFCSEATVYDNVRAAYYHLWDLIEANEEHLSSEVWSWVFRGDEGYVFTPLGALPPPDGSNPTESDVRQLWSLTFLAVRRNDQF